MRFEGRYSVLWHLLVRFILHHPSRTFSTLRTPSLKLSAMEILLGVSLRAWHGVNT